MCDFTFQPPLRAHLALLKAWGTRLVQHGRLGDGNPNSAATATASARLQGLWLRTLEHHGPRLAARHFEMVTLLWSQAADVAAAEAVLRDMAAAGVLTVRAYNHAVQAGLAAVPPATGNQEHHRRRRRRDAAGVAGGTQALMEDMVAHGLAPDAVTYNLFIKALCLVGQGNAAVDAMDTMRRAGHAPSHVTYNTVLALLPPTSRAVDRAMKLMEVSRRQHRDVCMGCFTARVRWVGFAVLTAG